MPDDRSVTHDEPRTVPWTGSEIFIGLFLAWFFWPAVVNTALKGIGFEHWYYPGVDPKDLSLRMALWVRALALPLQVMTFLLLFAALSGTKPEQLGLTTRRLGRNVLAGLAGGALLTPAVLGIYQLLKWLYAQTGEVEVEKHPLEQLPLPQLHPSEWVLLALTPIVAAPVLEELTFRGVLQPWLAMRRWGGHLVMLGSLALAVYSRWSHMAEAWPQGIGPVAITATPVLFVLILVPVYLLLWWRSPTPRVPAIFGTSVLFASIHADVCLAPLPLFVLALGLGVLADRTHSLVGPIVLHGLFNSVAFVQLVLTMIFPG
jgi:membrane protease YdiL (CAAX protease family)